MIAVQDVLFPVDASAGARSVDEVFYFILAVCAFFFVLIVVTGATFVWRYRRRRNSRPESSVAHNTLLEVVWSVVPAVLLGVIFYRGYSGYVELRTPPEDAYEIHGTAQKWSWTFTYPNGHVSDELHVPAGRPVQITLTSEDVIHSFFVRAFRVKMDTVPGRYSYAWFTATEPGEYEVQCTEYCGTGHSAMNARLVVHPPGEFERWLSEAADFLARLAPAEAGELLYRQRGCFQCHSVDGSPKTGPTFLGLAGSERELADGSRVVADANYLRESIVEPQAKVVRGWPAVMPTYQGRLTDQEITALIAYLESLPESSP